MRILHTSDWHLGRNFHGVHLLDAQAAMLESIVDVVRRQAIDVVVIAGDIYDRAVPSADAVSVLSHALAEIRAAGAVVVGISGNHDSAVRIGFAEPILAAGGVNLRGNVATAGDPVVLPRSSGDGAVAFYPIPYLEPEIARHALGAPEARSHERLLGVALERARVDLEQRKRRSPSLRAVAIVHAFVTGGQECDSELALSVGGSAEVALRSFDGFDYVALGHLHGRQTFGSGRVRYSGSPMAYSFSERNHTKGMWLLDLPEHGEMTVEPIDLPVFRSLHQIRGELEQLLVDPSWTAAEKGFVQAVLTDAVLPVDAMSKLRRRFPHAVLLGHEPTRELRPITSYAERVKGKDDIELMADFIEHVAGRPASDAEKCDLASAIDAVSPGVERRDQESGAAA